LPALTTPISRYALSAITSPARDDPTRKRVLPPGQNRFALVFLDAQAAERAPAGRRLNQTRLPEPSRIIGPYCPVPAYGAMKMSCEDAPLREPDGDGGRREVRLELKCWNSLRFGGGGAAASRVVADDVDFATMNFHENGVTPPAAQARADGHALTLREGHVGTKLSPSPCE